MLYINPQECIGCGACQDVCPNEAVYLDEDLPADQSVFGQIAEEWSARHDATGGSVTRGVIGVDDERVAALPARTGDDS
jgi:ferredoxin